MMEVVNYVVVFIMGFGSGAFVYLVIGAFAYSKRLAEWKSLMKMRDDQISRLTSIGINQAETEDVQ